MNTQARSSLSIVKYLCQFVPGIIRPPRIPMYRQTAKVAAGSLSDPVLVFIIAATVGDTLEARIVGCLYQACPSGGTSTARKPFPAVQAPAHRATVTTFPKRHEQLPVYM